MTHSHPPSLPTPGQGIDPDKLPGHWLLANMGKRVLRPGGLELTRRMLTQLHITPDDKVVEFAPGLGVTARLTLQRQPASYTAVERDPDAAKQTRQWLGEHPACRVITGLAQETGLPDTDATAVYGEAMLTMHARAHKLAVIREAFRLLQPGGRYGIHELCLCPDDLPHEQALAICRELGRTIHHQAQPLTVPQWRSLFEDEGFEVVHCSTVAMALLEPMRMIRDEGICRMARIMYRMWRQPQARQRIREMRRMFRQNRHHMAAICIVARKPSQAAAAA